ncbi:MAG: SocA family protein [Planctomycetaceae bacterium]|mgnify:CR=1 FL=1|nr:SocA family protein [Planctomycetaceae bacterium]
MNRLPIQKTIEAAGVLTGFEPTFRISRLRLLKLLYIAERESIQETGHPILGSTVVAMPHGPLHSKALDLIKGVHRQEPQWSAVFHNDGYMVVRLHDPGRSRLSRYEIEKLTEVSERYADKDDWEVARITEQFPEYKSCYSEGSSREIPLDAIVDALGRSDDKTAILQDAADRAVADRLFGP